MQPSLFGPKVTCDRSGPPLVRWEPGFHHALRGLGHECVFASEIEPQLRDVYLKNFPDAHGTVQFP